jgi:hypothetical protein
MGRSLWSCVQVGGCAHPRVHQFERVHKAVPSRRLRSQAVGCGFCFQLLVASCSCPRDACNVWSVGNAGSKVLLSWDAEQLVYLLLSRGAAGMLSGMYVCCVACVSDDSVVDYCSAVCICSEFLLCNEARASNADGLIPTINKHFDAYL